MSECSNCFQEYPKKELIYLESIMEDICPVCFEELESEINSKKEPKK